MPKMCDYCGGQGKWKSSLSPITGEVFYSQCLKCDGTGWIPDDVPPTKPATTEELSKMAKKHAAENIEFMRKSQIMNNMRSQFPSAFR